MAQAVVQACSSARARCALATRQPPPSHRMAPMKTQKAMGKGAIAEALANECELKKSVCAKLIGSLAEIASQEVSKSGIFTIPGLCRIKTRTKPATKAGKREVFGKVVMVKARPARKIVKAYPVKALKDSI